MVEASCKQSRDHAFLWRKDENQRALLTGPVGTLARQLLEWRPGIRASPARNIVEAFGVQTLPTKSWSNRYVPKRRLRFKRSPSCSRRIGNLRSSDRGEWRSGPVSRPAAENATDLSPAWIIVDQGRDLGDHGRQLRLDLNRFGHLHPA